MAAVAKPLLFLASLTICSGANILGIFPSPSHSHQYVYQILTNTLAARGHNVTIITPLVLKNLCSNVTVIDLSHTNAILGKKFIEIYGKDGKEMKTLSFWQGIKIRYSFGVMLSDIHFSSPEIKYLLSVKPRFDLALLEYPIQSYLGLIHHFGAPPVIGIMSRNIIGGVDDYMGNFNNPSIVPCPYFPFSDHMSFWQRTVNFLMYLVSSIYFQHTLSQQNEVMIRHCGDQTPSLWELQKNISLYLFSGSLASNYPKPLTPNIIELGPLHIAETKPLPQNLKKWFDGADKGVVLFSMGTSIIVDIEVQNRLNMFIEAFSSFPEFRFLWKWSSDSIPGQPKNVLVQKWVPQQDVLVHPKIRAFISQCGLQSTQEAIHFGVPVIGLPVQSDQKQNIHKLVTSKAGVMLDVTGLNKDMIVQALQSVLYNESFKENMNKLSNISRDILRSPLDKAVWWTEYVLRHNGAHHLKPASLDLHLYQFILLDVIFVIFIILLTTVILSVFIVKRVFTILRKKIKTE